MAAPEAGSLNGVGVLVTRPVSQALGIASLIKDAGGQPVLFPTIEIAEPDDPARLDDVINRLGEADIAIFVSANAALYAAGRIRARWRTLPEHLVLIAVGPASARTLAEQGLGNAVSPADGASSEALLELPLLTGVAGKRIVIFRGQGGRELLAETLHARGAQVEYAECYRRVIARVDPAPLVARWRQGRIHVVLIASGEALENLRTLLGPDGTMLLRQTPCIVASERIAGAARLLGMQATVARAADDRSFVSALEEWRAQQKSL